MNLERRIAALTARIARDSPEVLPILFWHHKKGEGIETGPSEKNEALPATIPAQAFFESDIKTV